MKKQVSAPTSLSDITLGQYQDFVKKTKGLEGDDLAIQTVSIFCKLNIESVMCISLLDIRSICEDINILFSLEARLQTVFKIDNCSFGFINDMENMMFNEYVDLDKYINNWSDMHRAMSVLFRPVIKSYKTQYSIEEYNGSSKYAGIMKDMSLEIAMAAVVFFYNLENELLQASLLSLVTEATEELTIQSKHSSMQSGDGIAQFMPSLMESIKRLKMPLELLSSQHLHI